MSQTELDKWLSKYFQQTTKLDSAGQEKLKNLLERFSIESKQSKFIESLFQNMQRAINNDNMKIIVKKYLFLVNLILEKDDNFVDQKKFKNAVSNQIVKHYLIILKQLLNNSQYDIIQLIKIYRKKWAKRISDLSFDKINSQAIKNLGFNLDRGFPDDIIEKITKGYHKRGFTKDDIEKYMSAQPQQQVKQSPRRERVQNSESSEEESNSPTKRVKRDRQPNYHENLYASDMMNHHSSYIPSNSFPIQQNYSVLNPINNFYANNNNSYPYMQPPIQQVRYNAVIPSDYRYNSGQAYYQPNAMNIHYPPVNTPSTQPSMSPYHLPHNQFREQPRKVKQDFFYKTREIIQILKQSQLHDCRQCGIYLTTHDNFEKHCHEHFVEQQKQFQAAHSRKDVICKKNPLPDIQQWSRSSKRGKQSQMKHFVPVKELLGERAQLCVRKCVVCSGQIQISWEQKLDVWAYDNAVRVRMQANLEKIAHYQCYVTIEDMLSRQSCGEQNRISL